MDGRDPMARGVGFLWQATRRMGALLDGVYPERHIRVINMGVSGNTSRDLSPLGRDTMALKPNWVTIMIGINDIWRQYDRPCTKSSMFMWMSTRPTFGPSLRGRYRM
ncbi:MAG: GDSL-type esterase/lipase family protein [Bianqueaceae bacterium]